MPLTGGRAWPQHAVAGHVAAPGQFATGGRNPGVRLDVAARGRGDADAQVAVDAGLGEQRPERQ